MSSENHIDHYESERVVLLNSLHTKLGEVAPLTWGLVWLSDLDRLRSLAELETTVLQCLFRSVLTDGKITEKFKSKNLFLLSRQGLLILYRVSETQTSKYALIIFFSLTHTHNALDHRVFRKLETSSRCRSRHTSTTKAKEADQIYGS
jgi:hypothetical protein